MTISFEEALANAETPRALLLGNGFSIAQAGDGRFGYSSLLDKAELDPDGPILKVFKTLDTLDFEVVMHALQYAAQIEDAYGYSDKGEKFRADSISVREALIHAVRAVHPGAQFEIPDKQKQSCGVFLRNFDSIFSLNYDLLLYWVILNTVSDRFSDGFSLGESVEGFRTFNKEAPCNTFYLHGALHLFLGERRQTLKRTVTSTTIINHIAKTIQDRKQLPLFVAEGLSSKKMERINSIPYLRHAYETFSFLKGTLLVFGHSLSENDHHLYDAVFRKESGIKKVIICVHAPEKNLQTAKERMAKFHERNGNVKIEYVDSSTVPAWTT